MVTEVISVVAGAVLGFLLGFVPRLYRALERRRYAKIKERRRRNGDKVEVWLIEYYSRPPRASDDLFESEIGDCSRKVPFLTRDDWLSPLRVKAASDDVLCFDRHLYHSFPVDRRLLKKRLKMGARIYHDGILETAYLHVIEDQDGPPLIRISSCPYNEMASSLIALEEETFKAALGRTFPGLRRSVPVRKEFYPRIPQPGEVRTRPFSVGCATVLAIQTGNSYEIAIQTRSATVVTAPLAKAVIPNFGFEPSCIGDTRSRFGLLFYNFMREYLEELFNYEELIGEMSQRRSDPDWFCELDEAKWLLSALDSGDFTLDYLGLGFDVLSGTAIIALLAVVKDSDVGLKIKNQIKVNWEVAAGTATRPALEFVDINDSKLGSWHRRNEFHVGSAFALSLALKKLASEVDESQTSGSQ